jgi:hypothetical protein
MHTVKMRGRAAAAIIVVLGALLGGCASSSSTGPRASQRFGPGQLTTEAINGIVLDFADDHVARVLEATDGLIATDPDSADRAALTEIALENAYSAFDIATSSNPIVAVSDMVVLASLSREAVRRTAIGRTLTQEERMRPESYDLPDEVIEQLFTREDRVLHRMFSFSERDARRAAGRVFYPEQLAELDALIDEWWLQNPSRRRVTHVRLDDFAAYRGAAVQTATGGPRNLLGLLFLDPFAGMDPTTREIAQSRLLAERVTFQVNRLPLIVALHARAIMYQSLTTQEVVSLRETAEEFGVTAGRLADTADRWPEDLATERDAALRQVAEIVETERDAAIRQFAEIVESERRAALTELESAVARQRDEIFAALDGQSKQLQGTLAELNAALENANALAASATETVRAVDDMDIENFQRLIESANESVASVERTIGAVERLAAPGAIDTQAAGIDQSVTVASESLGVVIDQAFRRAVRLIGLLLVGWVIAALTIRAIGPRVDRGAKSV